jgi:hypothetical protein
MALIEVQRALARLYTDEATRERFLADPAATGAALGLRADEAALLAQLPAAQLRHFAASLRRKRLGEVAKLLPLSHQALGARFAAHFWRYADTYLPRGTDKHRQDAIAFAAFLAGAAALDPPWAGDLARYEAAWLQCAEPARRLLRLRLGYAPADLVRAASAAAPPPPPRPILALWLRPPRTGHWHQLNLRLPRFRPVHRLT